jgi:hypothetical protein
LDIQNVGVLGNVADGAAVKNLQTATTLDFEKIRDFLADAITLLPHLPTSAQHEVRPVLDAIDDELKTANPNPSKIRAMLGSLKKIVEGIAGNVTAQGIISMVGRL